VRTVPILLATTLLALAPLSLDAKTTSKAETAPPATGPRVIMDLKKVKGLYYSPAPEYPKEAIEKHWGGSGLYEVQFRRDGRVWVVYVTLSTGHKILDDAVVATLHQWRSWKGYKLIVVGAWIKFDPGAISKSPHAR
jgi:TonB family protein